MGNALRTAREAAGLTQAEAAKRAGVCEAQYQNYEYGKNEPKARTAVRIARALDSTVEDLFPAE